MNKLLTYVIVTGMIILTLGVSGCAEQVMAIPGTLIEGTGNVIQSVWHLATDWIPLGSDAVE
ncbi:uncharacterized protein METZ01_LOCUS223341 [marine metagenome]|uniref:Uncharacterized protein n=1 Tax=marine metagenome TaxID=408172 RepID=A0A382G7D6_9ZZZZ